MAAATDISVDPAVAAVQSELTRKKKKVKAKKCFRFTPEWLSQKFYNFCV